MSEIATEGQGSAPALRLRYPLTPADALAWEALPTEARAWAKAAHFAPWIALGLGWGVTEDQGLALWLRACLVAAPALAVWALTQALFARGRRRRALARVPAPVAMLCTEGQGTLTFHPEARPQEARTLTPQDVRQVVLTPTHLFLDAAPALLILPRAALPEAPDLAARWETLSRQAQP